MISMSAFVVENQETIEFPVHFFKKERANGKTFEFNQIEEKMDKIVVYFVSFYF